MYIKVNFIIEEDLEKFSKNSSWEIHLELA